MIGKPEKVRYRVSFEVELSTPWAKDVLCQEATRVATSESKQPSDVEAVVAEFRSRYGYTPDCFLDAGKNCLNKPTYDLEFEVLDQYGNIIDSRKTTEKW